MGQDNVNTIIQGNVFENIHKLPDNSVDCVWTSPPYYKQRFYQVPDVVIGGRFNCAHEWCESIVHHDNLRYRKGVNTTVGNHSNPEIYDNPKKKISLCSLCGAYKGQLGLEETPDLFIEHLALLFDEFFRVLKPEGNVFINIGDTFAGSTSKSSLGLIGKEKIERSEKLKENSSFYNQYYKPKQKLLIPHRFAISMQNRGWLCRGDWVWSKPNSLPESCQDRLFERKEYVFHFVKNKKYYFDLESIKIPCVSEGVNAIKNPGDVLEINTEANREAHYALAPKKLIEMCLKAGCPDVGIVLDPFFGAGTTGIVAKQLGLNYIGFELNPDYIQIAEKRIESIKIIGDNYVVEKNELQELLF